ncbi:MAG TPA: DNA primase, partial [Clostridiales bacterium]|nr:DNA primase [Clostridiales bacterium]
EITKEYVNTIISDDFNADNIFTDIDLDDDSIKTMFYDCYKRLKIKYLEGLRTVKNKDLTNINDEIMQKEKMNEILKLAKKIKSLKEEVY